MRLDDIMVHHDAPSESEPPHLSPSRRRKRIVLAITVSIMIVIIIVAVAASLLTSSSSPNNNDFDITNNKHGASSPAFMDVIDQTVIRQHSSSSTSTSNFNRTKNNNNNNCLYNEGLWKLQLQTDNYSYETKWELYDASTQQILAYGPPTNTNYNKLTNYIGILCLPIGEYYIRWYDIMGDNICCNYGRGDWTVSVNGEVVLQNDPNDKFTQRDFTFIVTPLSAPTNTNQSDGSDDFSGTFLIMPRPNDPVMCIELKSDGTIYELHNLPSNFDYMEEGLVSGISSIILPVGSEIFFNNGTIDMKGEAPSVSTNRLLYNHHHDKDDVDENASTTLTRTNVRSSYSNQRHLTNYIGEYSVLVVRVIAADRSTTSDETTLSNSVFGNGIDATSVNLVSQFKACSYDQMNFVKASNRSGKSSSMNNEDVKIRNGIVTISLPTVSTAQGDAYMRNTLTIELNEMFDVARPSQLADFLIYCLPKGTYTGARPGEGIAYAYINSWLSVFNDEWCRSSSLLMHELGHCINLGHSNEDGKPYEDETGTMGASYPNKNGPRRCFNAAKSWQTGWYKDKSVTINSNNGAAKCFNGILHGIADYPIATTVLLKVQSRSGNDYYINFNAKKGINTGTQEGGNMVTVVRRPRGVRDSYSESELVAKLGAGESYSFTGYTVTVGEIDTKIGTARVVVLSTGNKSCDAN